MNHTPRVIELLAPARNLECGKAAIDHGADAVYIGATHFGARAAATNSIDDVAALCHYAHRYGARVYATVNTFVYDSELASLPELLLGLAQAGVDAMLVQDMAVVECVERLKSEGHDMPQLHASTQTDIRTPERARWLAAQGFSRLVLARELSIEEIARIHEEVPQAQLEVFVHGALCVSFSGACTASQYCFSRSANRGECAQFCRMPFSLTDSTGAVVARRGHLLSLRDMCRIDHIEALLQAGVCSLKIEGRLKDVDYVKNVVAAYSQRLDEIIARHPDLYCRASLGHAEYTFQPDVNRTYNRGYTTYFLNGRTADIWSPLTPKATGPRIGRVKSISHRTIVVSTTTPLANGDGLCFFDSDGQLVGFRVNRVEGNHVYPLSMPPRLAVGTTLYRNADQAMTALLSRPSAQRRIGISLVLTHLYDIITLTATVCQNPMLSATCTIPSRCDKARQPQADVQRRQLEKWGNTQFSVRSVSLADDVDTFFIPATVLSTLRRSLSEKLSQVITASLAVHEPFAPPSAPSNPGAPPLAANAMAAEYYRVRGITPIPAFEVTPSPHPLLMECRHCLRFSLGHCVRRGGTPPTWREPLSLVLDDGRRFPLQFDCSHCQMNVYGQD